MTPVSATSCASSRYPSAAKKVEIDAQASDRGAVLYQIAQRAYRGPERVQRGVLAELHAERWVNVCDHSEGLCQAAVACDSDVYENQAHNPFRQTRPAYTKACCAAARCAATTSSSRAMNVVVELSARFN